MKVPSNRITEIRIFMRSFLKELYPFEEIDSMFHILMETYCSMNKNAVISGKRDTINESELLLVYDAIKELASGRPIQYVTGKSWFYGLEFKVTPDVLIPRPETEELVDKIIKENKDRKGLRILDVGTGSGCIAITLQKNLINAFVFAIDISRKAIDIAKYNAAIHTASIWFKKSDFLKESQWHKLPEFDIIVSNPPYVTEEDKKLMHKNVLEHEPHLALFPSDCSAIQFYHNLFRFAVQKNAVTKIYAEINESKAQEIIMLAKSQGITDICIHKDFRGKDRFFTGITAKNPSITNFLKPDDGPWC